MNDDWMNKIETAKAEGRVIDAMSMEAIRKNGQRGRSIAEEALQTINGERQDQYGNPEDTFKQIAALWEAYLGTKVTPVMVADMMQLLKIARERHGRGKRDNLVDNIGYALLSAKMRGYDE